MEKIKHEERVEVVTVHEFYCDDCGKFLGSSMELDDGYYAEIGAKSWKYGDLKLKGHYCDKCMVKIGERIEETLRGFGFKERG